MPAFDKMVAGYANMWDSAKILDTKTALAANVADRILMIKSTLQAAEQASGPPWWWIGAILYREADLDLACYVGNGQKLNRITTVVPIGRGPFLSFVAGCVDAFTLQKIGTTPLTKIPPEQWTIEFSLYAAEELNGEGYQKHGENAPYVWAGTNHEQKGLYTSDGSFDSNAVDNRLGVAAVIAGLAMKDSSVMVPRSPRRPAVMPTGPSGAVAGAATPASIPPSVPTVNAPILSLPGGPNVILDIEHGMESILNMLPTLAMFVPQLAIVIPFLPLIKEGLVAAEDFETTKSTGGDIFTVIASHMHALADELQSVFVKK